MKGPGPSTGAPPQRLRTGHGSQKPASPSGQNGDPLDSAGRYTSQHGPVSCGVFFEPSIGNLRLALKERYRTDTRFAGLFLDPTPIFHRTHAFLARLDIPRIAKSRAQSSPGAPLGAATRTTRQAAANKFRQLQILLYQASYHFSTSSPAAPFVAHCPQHKLILEPETFSSTEDPRGARTQFHFSIPQHWAPTQASHSSPRSLRPTRARGSLFCLGRVALHSRCRPGLLGPDWLSSASWFIEPWQASSGFRLPDLH